MEQAFELWWQSIQDNPEIISFEDLEEIMLPIYIDAMRWRSFKDTPIDKIAERQREIDADAMNAIMEEQIIKAVEKQKQIDEAEFAKEMQEQKKAIIGKVLKYVEGVNALAVLGMPTIDTDMLQKALEETK